MSNNIYEQFNDIDFNVEEYEFEKLSEMEKKRMRNNFYNKKKKNNKYIYIAASIAMGVIFLNTSLGQEVYGKAESKVNHLGYSISQALGLRKDLEDYASVVNKTVENKGVEIKLNDVILDRDEMTLSILLEAGRDARSFILDDEIRINGKKVKINSSSGSMEVLGENLFGSVSHISIDEIDLDKELDVEYKVNSVMFFQEEEREELVKGPWKFEFKSNSEELMNGSETYEIGHVLKVEDVDFTFSELYITELGSKIYGTRSSNIAYDIELIGEDNNGLPVKYYASSMDGNKIIYKEAGQVDFSNLDYIDLEFFYREYPEESGRISGEFKSVGEKIRINLK